MVPAETPPTEKSEGSNCALTQCHRTDESNKFLPSLHNCPLRELAVQDQLSGNDIRYLPLPPYEVRPTRMESWQYDYLLKNICRKGLTQRTAPCRSKDGRSLVLTAQIVYSFCWTLVFLNFLQRQTLSHFLPAPEEFLTMWAFLQWLPLVQSLLVWRLSEH
jgi:hypothetical protein